jgi:hypothetical protein
MRTVLAIVGTITIATSSILAVSRQSATEQERLGRAEALDTIRALNTAEVTEFMQHNAYVPLGRAIQNLKWKSDLTIRHINVPPESMSAAVKDYQISLTVSTDAKYYTVQLTPAKTAPDCAVGWFSDPSGVIYSGPSLECIQ